MNEKEAKKWIRENLHPQFDCNVVHHKYRAEGYLECLNKAKMLEDSLRWVELNTQEVCPICDEKYSCVHFNVHEHIKEVLADYEKIK